jgi:hypothetical protein
MQHKYMVLLTTLIIFSLLIAPAGTAQAQQAILDGLLATSVSCQVTAGQVLINEIFPAPQVMDRNGSNYITPLQYD